MKRGEEITLEQMIDEMVGAGVSMFTVAHWDLQGPHIWRVDVSIGGDAEISIYGRTPTEALRLAYDAVESFRNEVP